MSYIAWIEILFRMTTNLFTLHTLLGNIPSDILSDPMATHKNSLFCKMSPLNKCGNTMGSINIILSYSHITIIKHNAINQNSTLPNYQDKKRSIPSTHILEDKTKSEVWFITSIQPWMSLSVSFCNWESTGKFHLLNVFKFAISSTIKLMFVCEITGEM